MFSVLSGHSVQPPTDSGHKMMDGPCAALPAAENHLTDLRPDLENRLRPRSRPVSHIYSYFFKSFKRLQAFIYELLPWQRRLEATSFHLRARGA